MHQRLPIHEQLVQRSGPLILLLCSEDEMGPRELAEIFEKTENRASPLAGPTTAAILHLICDLAKSLDIESLDVVFDAVLKTYAAGGCERTAPRAKFVESLCKSVFVHNSDYMAHDGRAFGAALQLLWSWAQTELSSGASNNRASQFLRSIFVVIRASPVYTITRAHREQFGSITSRFASLCLENLRSRSAVEPTLLFLERFLGSEWDVPPTVLEDLLGECVEEVADHMNATDDCDDVEMIDFHSESALSSRLAFLRFLIRNFDLCEERSPDVLHELLVTSAKSTKISHLEELLVWFRGIFHELASDIALDEENDEVISELCMKISARFVGFLHDAFQGPDADASALCSTTCFEAFSRILRFLNNDSADSDSAATSAEVQQKSRFLCWFFALHLKDRNDRAIHILNRSYIFRVPLSDPDVGVAEAERQLQLVQEYIEHVRDVLRSHSGVTNPEVFSNAVRCLKSLVFLFRVEARQSVLDFLPSDEKGNDLTRLENFVAALATTTDDIGEQWCCCFDGFVFFA
jgi:hypothetical protein